MFEKIRKLFQNILLQRVLPSAVFRPSRLLRETLPDAPPTSPELWSFEKAFFFLCVPLFLFIACEKVSEDELKSSSVKPPLTASAELALATAEIQTVSGKTYRVTVEIAQTEEERAKGLMGRDSLPENHGMWFIFPTTVQDSFWMKDTKISLDILFVSEEGKIVDIISNTTPFSTDLLTSQVTYRYVLEVNAGFAASHVIAKGDKITISLDSK